MSSRGLAFRRWANRRAKSHVRFVLKYVWQEEEKWITPERVGLNASCHLKPCSRPWCCGNPRRMPGPERLTLAERRASLDDDFTLSVPYWNSDERRMDEWWDDFWWEEIWYWMGLGHVKQG